METSSSRGASERRATAVSRPEAHNNDPISSDQMAREEEALMRLALDMSMASQSSWEQSDSYDAIQCIKFLEAVLYLYLRDTSQNIVDILGRDAHVRMIDIHVFLAYRNDIFPEMTVVYDIIDMNWSSVHSVISKLKRTQEKVLRILNNPTDEQTVIELVELNESIQSVLFKVETFLPTQVIQEISEQRNSLTSFDTTALNNSHERSAFVSIAEAITSMVTGDHPIAADAVSYLIDQCNLSGEEKSSAFKEMHKFKLLEALLANIARFSGWPAVEIRAINLLCATVTTIDDPNRLIVQAGDILSLFYMWQIQANNGMRRELDEILSLLDDAVAANTTSGANYRTSTKASDIRNMLANKQRLRQYLDDQRCKIETLVLVSAAIAKLGKVTSRKWLDTGFNPTSFGSTLSPSKSSSPLIDMHFASPSAMTGEAISVMDTIFNIISYINDANLLSEEIVTLTRGDMSAHRRRMSTDYRPCFPHIDYFYDEHCSQLMNDDVGAVERSLVLCSVCISYFAEVILCRSIIAAHTNESGVGILLLLRDWIEKGCKYLKSELSTLQLGFDEESSHDVHMLDEDMAIHELVRYSVQSIMLMVGGSEFNGYYTSFPIRSTCSSEGVSPNQSSNRLSLDESAITSIDNHILHHGVSDIIVEFLAITVQLHNLAENLDTMNSNPITLPKNITMSLTQTLYQLSSRIHNRQALQAVSAPLVLCEIFQCIVSDNKLFNRLLKSSSIRHMDSVNPDDKVQRSFSHDSNNNHKFHDDEGSLRSTESSIISSSLDALAFYLNDAATSAAMAASLQEHYIIDTKTPSLPSSPTDILLIDRISSWNFIDAIRFIASLAPRSNVRLSCLRIVSILTEWHQSLRAVAESDIVSVLVKICSDSEELEHIYEQQLGNRHSNHSMDGSNRGKGHHSPMPPPPILTTSTSISNSNSNHRGSTNTSAIAHTGSSHSSGRSSSFSFGFAVPSASRSTTGSGTSFKISENTDQPTSSSSTDNGSFIHRDSFVDDVSMKIAKYDSAFLEISSPDALSMEETAVAMLALANISQAKRGYAELLFRYGLLDVSLMLMESRRMEICHHAIRCIASLCSVLSALPSNYSGKDGYRGKLELCHEALKCCTKAIRNTDLILAARKDALIGLADLSKPGSDVWESISEDIAIDPLFDVVTILVDPDRKSRDLQDAAELVLKSIGFAGGVNDLPSSSFNYDVLLDWFRLKRSLSPQREAWSIVYSWLEDLFRAYDDGAIWHRLNHNDIMDASLARKAAAILRTNIVDDLSAAEALHKYSLPNPASIRKNIGGIFKALPFCFSQPTEIMHDDDHDNGNGGKSIPSTPSSIDRPSQLGMLRNIVVGSPASTVTSSSNAHDTPSKLFEWLDQIPTNILQLFDVFHTSKLIQLCMLDMLSLGLCHNEESIALMQLRASAPTSSLPHPLYILPKPFTTSYLLLPSRMYTGQTFTRISRVIERIIGDEVNDRYWCLSFKDSEFYGDFHETLLSTLGRCPRIIGLSIAGSKIDHDAHLGHLGGKVPSSIRFLSFRSCLSGDSVQALCILLKQHNAAIMHMPFKDLNRLSKSLIMKIHNDHISSFSGQLDDSSHKQSSDNQPVAVVPYIMMLRPSMQEFIRSRPLKGLVCLSITHSILSSKDVEYIVDLLSIHHTSPASSKKPTTSSTTNHDHHLQHHRHMQGLRFLDLSFDHFSDQDCADLLRGAAHGPLEGLDLSGNVIVKATAFLVAVDNVLANASYPFHDPMADKLSYLRHLSLSHCNLTSKAVKGLLDLLQQNQSLASLDLSHNLIHRDNDSNKHIIAAKDAMREFLKKNTCMRSLDLSHMSLKRESIISLQLGLLENETMLLMPLHGNPIHEAMNSMSQIRNKLAQNREKYLHQSDAHVLLSATPIPSRDTSTHDGPLSPHPPNELVMRTESDKSDSTTSLSSYASLASSLHVLFSAPLAWRDQSGKIHPVEMLDYSAEREQIIQVFREVQRDISVNFGFATTESLRTALSLNCRALHFAGHGHRSYLNFEDGNSGLQLIKVNQLISLLTAGGNSNLQFVFVSACHSRNTGQAFIDAGVPHVVCCKVDEMIQDSAAMAFTRAFYVALLSGSNVRQAFHIAREALKVSPYVSNSVLEGDKFILLPEHASHDQPMFNNPVVSNWPLAGRHHIKGRGFTAASWLTAKDNDTGETVLDHMEYDDSLTFLHTLPAPIPDFEGREVDMYRIITAIAMKRQVTIVGDYGIGKSALTSGVCNYIADRGIFGDGVMFLRATPNLSLKSLLLQILHILVHESRSAKLAARMQAISSIADYKAHIEDDHINHESDSLSKLQENVLTCLSPMRMLLVIDNIDNLLPVSSSSSNEQAVAELHHFLSHLFEHCRFIKLLVTSTETLFMRHVKDYGVIETSVSIGPLTLRNSLRLFAKLAPPLMTSKDKGDFIHNLTPKNQDYVTTSSANINVAGAKILSMFGDGHPAKIVKLACQANQETVDELKKQGMRIINATTIPPSLSSQYHSIGGHNTVFNSSFVSIDLSHPSHRPALASRAVTTQGSVQRILIDFDPLSSSPSTSSVSDHFSPTPSHDVESLTPPPPAATASTMSQRYVNLASQLPPMRQPTPDDKPAVEEDLLNAWMKS